MLAHLDRPSHPVSPDRLESIEGVDLAAPHHAPNAPEPAPSTVGRLRRKPRLAEPYSMITTLAAPAQRSDLQPDPVQVDAREPLPGVFVHSGGQVFRPSLPRPCPGPMARSGYRLGPATA